MSSTGTKADDGKPLFRDADEGASTRTAQDHAFDRYDRLPGRFGWWSSGAIAAPEGASGSRQWAALVAGAVWWLLLQAYGFAITLVWVLLGGDAEGFFLAAPSDPVIGLLSLVVFLAAMPIGVAIGMRAERLTGWRSGLVVGIGPVVWAIVAGLVPGESLTMIGVAIGFLVVYVRRRRRAAR